MNFELKAVTWGLLIIAIMLEVSGTVAMKLSDGFTKVIPIIAMLILYAMGLGLLALTLKVIDVSVAYAVWSGLGTVLITFIGILWFKEPATTIKMISIALIVVGVVGLNLESGG
ncbi:multidrug efflux SMR transporter [Candidatus Halobeggiatoa sp. HSG11]|nr:multidrug efflux SMR transporter [Candidatus Halobeggiatoa sp. HSG11]